ncbi:MAG: DUF6689 family protein [Dokdonella sp.]
MAWAFIISLSLLLCATGAMAGVVVTISGNQALANISLTNGSGTFTADVTITFDSPSNLTAEELNLTAVLVDPNDPTLLTRLPACTPSCVSVDPAFPMLITVEPVSYPWMFRSGFETADTEPENLNFLNTYEFEVHTSNLDCSAPAAGVSCPITAYRLFKAPIGGNFDDITDDVLKGSVRARGRGGAFSQFLVVQDTRDSLSVEQGKSFNLEARIRSASLSNTLRSDLLGQLAQVQVAVLLDQNYAQAISYLDQLIFEIQAHAGIDVFNRWSSDHNLVNDAGEMLSLAQTLRYTLVRLQNGH